MSASSPKSRFYFCTRHITVTFEPINDYFYEYTIMNDRDLVKIFPYLNRILVIANGNMRLL